VKILWEQNKKKLKAVQLNMTLTGKVAPRVISRGKGFCGKI
jgi:type III secretion system FlhB-like substrate exporter